MPTVSFINTSTGATQHLDAISGDGSSGNPFVLSRTTTLYLGGTEVAADNPLPIGAAAPSTRAISSALLLGSFFQEGG